MTYPNTLIFVDLMAEDPAAAGEFYAAVMGWENDPRPHGVFHRMVPGQNFKLANGEQSEVGNLHLGITSSLNARPHPSPDGVEPREVSEGRKSRIYVMVSDDDSHERILGEAEKRGATILWKDHYWKEFNGFNHAFRDPWGNEIILWVKGGDNPVIPPSYTQE
ncbi:VOC family protein [Hirschia baltica]|uniref:Glyoxalase/bleomycin resistance protein/dioxygenase n=1 Tax=Hirschia baltica (strain ATCC 49814 / DSM 5838 / IFAM 1418) TaxID=582402 RepID=C6XP46_HIRBI|nr:VOC family protein [Hirschia baltica]ACT60226.1 glyoxalase/bleomycin resistance protein/dioxygenase [Hirschia baltica ATCC 49814]